MCIGFTQYKPLSYYEFMDKISYRSRCSMFFYKYLNNSLYHNGYTYKLGLNIDPNEFNPSGTCKSGGFYFTDITNLSNFSAYGNKIAKIKLLEDAVYYIDPSGDKYKTNKFYIVDIVDAKDIVLPKKM